MKVTSAPIPVPTPPKEITIVLTEQEANILAGIMGGSSSGGNDLKPFFERSMIGRSGRFAYDPRFGFKLYEALKPHIYH
jgi:hypothetical protein